jgi:hypothetical protein
MGHLVNPNGAHVRMQDAIDHDNALAAGRHAESVRRSPERSSLYQLWLRPIRGPFERAAETVHKPIGQLTVPEAVDWAACLGYAALTGYVIGKMAGNLLEVGLGGRRR